MPTHVDTPHGRISMSGCIRYARTRQEHGPIQPLFFMASPPIGCVGIVHASQPGSEQSQHTEHGGTGVVVGVILESIPGLCQLLHDL
jgi:hypothetical protein